VDIKQLIKKIRKFFNKRNILIICAVFAAAVILAVIIPVSAKQKPVIWYVDEALEKNWGQILADYNPPSQANIVQVWDGITLPQEEGMVISFKPWVETQEIVKVFHRLSWELEHDGAHVLAVDPWMIFNKHTNPPITYERISGSGGRGVILIPGRDIEAVRAWSSRFIQEKPGSFPQGNGIWKTWESKIFDTGLFSPGMRGYDWNAVFFRLMGADQAWLYAPISKIRGYRDPRKSILEASPFPQQGGIEASMLAKILWALPVKSASGKTQKTINNVLTWLKSPEIQTVIADSMDMIPADPYGTPYDPVSLTTHRLWLTTVWIYSIYE